MTDEDLREIDKRIYYEVMGLKEIDREIHEPTSRIPGHHLVVYHYEIPFYSSEIKSAWFVVEKIKTVTQEPYQPPLFHLMRDEKGKWRAGYKQFIDWIQWEEADTAPLAICLFALQSIQ